MSLADAGELVGSLDEVRRVLRNPLVTIGHLARFLPVQSQFEIRPEAGGADPLVGLYAYMRHHRMPASLALLLVHPATRSDADVVDAVLRVVGDFAATPHGLCFLAAHPDATSLVLRALMRPPSSAPAPANAVGNTPTKPLVAQACPKNQLCNQKLKFKHSWSCSVCAFSKLQFVL